MSTNAFLSACVHVINDLCERTEWDNDSDDSDYDANFLIETGLATRTYPILHVVSHVRSNEESIKLTG